ncbi:cell division protein [Streptomyces sp. NBC_01276]|uniref:cell division protein n=1 Tax=Streptomyces sp. NBC_01276 TaxID=2903808 RepID=UPI00352C4150
MSQQGAEDWWQKLYDDPDAGPEPDPGDTLDQRFRSAATLMTGPAPEVPAARRGPDGRPEGPEPPRHPGPPGLVPPTRTRPSPDGPPPRPAGDDPRPAPSVPIDSDVPPAVAVPPARRAPEPPTVGPGVSGGSSEEPGAERDGGVTAGDPPSGPPGVPPVPPPPVRGGTSVVPPPPWPPAGPARGGAPATGPQPPARPVGVPGDVPPEGPPPPAGPPPTDGSGMPARPVPGEPPAAGPSAPEPPGREAPLRPGPADPRVAGETGYVRGDVVVPPVEAGGAPPAWRWPPPPGTAEPARAALSETPATPGTPDAPDAPDAPESPSYGPRPAVRHLGDRAPTYAPEPGALPAADPAALDFLTPDTVLEGARYGTYTLRAASLRGDSARFRGEARRDLLLTARFGGGDDGLVLVVLAGGDRAAPGAREAAAELGHSVAAAVGRSRERLADDIRAGRREALLSGLQRLTDRGYGRLRARAAELGLAEEAYTAGLRGLLLPLDPECRNRVCFGAGAGGLFRLRAGRWQDLEADGPPAGGFRFRAAVARPGDTLLLCSGGLADPMREEGLLPDELASRWSQGEPPGLAAFLADTQLRLKGYADDRTAAAVWEA